MQAKKLAKNRNTVLSWQLLLPLEPVPLLFSFAVSLLLLSQFYTDAQNYGVVTLTHLQYVTSQHPHIISLNSEELSLRLHWWFWFIPETTFNFYSCLQGALESLNNNKLIFGVSVTSLWQKHWYRLHNKSDNLLDTFVSDLQSNNLLIFPNIPIFSLKTTHLIIIIFFFVFQTS